MVLKVDNKICLRNLILILTIIKVRRLEGAGNLFRMSDDTTVKAVFLGKLAGRRKAGTPELSG